MIENNFEIKESHIDFVDKIVKERWDSGGLFKEKYLYYPEKYLMYDWNSIETLIINYMKEGEEDNIKKLLRDNIGKDWEWLMNYFHNEK